MSANRRYVAIVAIGVLLASAGAGAASDVPRIEMTSSATSVGKGEVFNLVVRVVTEEEPVDEVTLPDLSDFEIISKSVSNPVSVQIGFGTGQKGGMISTYTREYDIWLKSRKPGKYKLDAPAVTWKGKKYKGRHVTITVTNTPPKQTTVPTKPTSPFPDMDWPFKMPSQPTPQPMPQPSMPVPQPQPSIPVPDDAETTGDVEDLLPEDLDGAAWDPDMFLQTVVEPKEATIGQQVTLTLLLYSRVTVGTIDISTEPGTDKFWVKDLLPPSGKIEWQNKVVQGTVFDVGVLRKIALFPTEAGTITITPATVKTAVPFGGLFGGGNYTRSAVPVEVVVNPLPAAGKPGGFDPSAVGSYTLDGDLEPLETKVNQPVTFTVTLKGRGNIEMIRAPEIVLPEGVKTYDPLVTDLVNLTGGVVGGKKKIEYMIIPTKPGELTIGPLVWPFFDPERGEYVDLEVPASVLSVLPDAGAKQDGGEEDDPVVDMGDDGEKLRPIRTVAALRRPEQQIVRTPWFLTAVVVPPGLLAIVLLVGLGRNLASGVRRRNPSGAALKQARAILRKASSSADPGEFYVEVQKAIYLYIETRFSIPATGMTGPELLDALSRMGVEPDLADHVVKETENCEFARYGRSSTERNLDMNEVQSRVLDVLTRLEKHEPPKPAGGKEVRR